MGEEKQDKKIIPFFFYLEVVHPKFHLEQLLLTRLCLKKAMRQKLVILLVVVVRQFSRRLLLISYQALTVVSAQNIQYDFYSGASSLFFTSKKLIN
jgi:hypothetical protein